MNWSQLFILTISIPEIVIRGTVVYLSLFAALRFVLKRESGNLGLADLLLVVIIADATQGAMAGDQKSLGDGLILAATLICWNYLLDWLMFQFPAFERLLQPPPVLLIRDGKYLWRNMRKEMITQQELMSEIHKEGLENLTQVRHAYMEGDGRISIIKTAG